VRDCCASADRVIYAGEPRKAAPVLDLHWQVLLHICPQRGIWLSCRPENGIWAGLWTPPIIELAGAPDREPAHIHQLTHRRLHLYAEQSAQPPGGDGEWARSIEGYALPTGIHRLLERAL
jgi:A/G-specific adenine glycosylase